MQCTKERKTRRSCLKGLIAGAAAGAMMALPTAEAAAEKIKLGIMLPYSGTYAQLGEMITEGIQLAIKENGDRLGGKEVEYVILDSEADAGRAVRNAQQLVSGENVDVLIGPVHSGVAMGMLRVAHETGVPFIIPNAGLSAATGELCAPNIFRTSFTMWQTSYPMAAVAKDLGYDEVVTMSWRYGAGTDALEAFREGFEEVGGTIVQEMYVPFPEVEFQAQLTEIASIDPDAVFVFFAGGGAVKFVQDYAAAGLKDSVPLLGAGFLTDGTLHAQGEAAEGILTTQHYADALDNAANNHFRAAFEEEYGRAPDVYAVQGYDTGLLLVEAAAKVDGELSGRDAFFEALRTAKIESPRGEWSFSKAQHPIQNIYLREVRGGRNEVVDIAAEALADPARGCEMAD